LSLDDTFVLDTREIVSPGGLPRLDVTITLNGETASFDRGAIERVTVNTRDGNDTVQLNSSPHGRLYVINLGTGNDEVDISPTTQDLQSNMASIRVRGDAGVGTLNLYDTATTHKATYELKPAPEGPDQSIITQATDVKAMAFPIYYKNLWFVNLVTSSGGNTVSVDDTAALFSTTVYGGSGGTDMEVHGTTSPLNYVGQSNADSVLIGKLGPNGGRTVSSIQGQVNLSDPEHALYLLVDDDADMATHLVQITDSRIAHLAPADITYQKSDIGKMVIVEGRGVHAYVGQGTP